MYYLREGIHLRGFAQVYTLVEYKNEAFALFTDLMSSIWTDFTRMIFHVEVNLEAPPGMGPPQAPIPAGGSSTRPARVSYSSGITAGAGAIAAAAAAAPEMGATALQDGDDLAAQLPHVEQRRVSEDEQIGRNDPCWCGSGKKFKRCHGA